MAVIIVLSQVKDNKMHFLEWVVKQEKKQQQQQQKTVNLLVCVICNYKITVDSRFQFPTI